jgi:hypothetical protein
MVRDSDRIELVAAKSDHAFHLPAAARPHHRPPGRPHRLPSQLAGHEAPTNAEGVKAVLRGIRRPIGATKQDKTPVTAGLVTETDICSQAARGMRYWTGSGCDGLDLDLARNMCCYQDSHSSTKRYSISLRRLEV